MAEKRKYTIVEHAEEDSDRNASSTVSKKAHKSDFATCNHKPDEPKEREGANELLLQLQELFPKKEFRLSKLRRNGDFTVQMKCGKNWSRTCIHARSHARCTLCGDGSSLCDHGIRRIMCITCDGKGLCPHRKQPHQCSLCGYCEHGKTPRRCREGCGGASFCVHETRKARCYACGGSDICPIHQQRKEFCEPPCGTGTGLCKTPDCSKIRVKDGFCQCCHPDYVEKHKGVSLMACRFMDLFAAVKGVSIQHSHYNDDKTLSRDEYRAPEMKRAPVDGFIREQKVIVEFLGDEFHGHPMTRICRKRDKNYCGVDYEVLFERTEAKFSQLVSFGYNVWYIWEYDYLRYTKEAKKDSSLTLESFVRVFSGELEWQ